MSGNTEDPTEAIRSLRPGPDEYDDFYEPYLARVPDGDVTGTLERQGTSLAELLRSVAPGHESFQYAPGKWTVREVVGHVIDCERMFGYRALHIARRDPAPLPDMDEMLWAGASNAADRRLAELTEELVAVRRSTVTLFRGLSPQAWERRGVASEREVSVRALAWIAAGHAAHHRAILVERYGLEKPA